MNLRMYRHKTLRYINRIYNDYKYGSVIRLGSNKLAKKVTILCCSLALGYIIFLNTFYQVKLPSHINEEDYLPYEPEVDVDFPISGRKVPIIPHIIHQTYRSEDIPHYYAQYAKTFVDLNPSWEYYFWTDEAARKLITNKYPHLLSLWDTYGDPINKADALRYVVLYEYGGVYVDLDFECLRPLDRATYKYSCIIPTEPFEQIAFRLGHPYLINNAILMVRPKHPFFKQLIDNLINYQMLETNVDKAGPMFMTSQFFIYNKFNSSDYYKTVQVFDSTSPNFYKGTLPEDDKDAVYVPNTRYFMNTMDTHAFKETRYYWKCRYFDQLDLLQQRACVELKKRGFNRTPNKFVFTQHHWFQAHNPLTVFIKHYFGWLYPTKKVNIFTISPKCKIYGKNMES